MELKLGYREPVNKTPVASLVRKSGKPKRTSNQILVFMLLYYLSFVISYI